MPNYNYEKRRNDKIKDMTEDLLNRIRKKLGDNETKKIEGKITKIKSQVDLHNIIDIEKIKKLDYSNIFTNMKNFLNLDDKQKGGETPPVRSVFRSPYNDDVEDDVYIDIEDIIQNNFDADLTIELQQEQRLIEQEIQERNEAYQQQIERNRIYDEQLRSFQQLMQERDETYQREILEIMRNQRLQFRELQQQQQERNSMVIENQNVQPIINDDKHILNLMNPLMNNIEDNYQQGTAEMTKQMYQKQMEEQMETMRKEEQDKLEELEILKKKLQELDRYMNEQGRILPLGHYSTSDIFKICYGCLYIIHTLIPFPPILAAIFAPILLLIIIIRKIISSINRQETGGKKTNKRKTKKRKSNRNKLKKNLKKKTKKVKKVKKTKSKK